MYLGGGLSISLFWSQTCTGLTEGPCGHTSLVRVSLNMERSHRGGMLSPLWSLRSRRLRQ